MKLLDNFFDSVIPDVAHRRASFEFICNRLLEKSEPFRIVETGTARAPHNFIGDGCSTIIWDNLNNLFTKNQSTVISVDVDFESIQKASAAVDNVTFINQDSVTYLRQLFMENTADKIDLLYLDSFDYFPGMELQSMAHHLAELTAVYFGLKSGCYIMVDDCHHAHAGKHVMVREFLGMLRVFPVFEGYQTIWQKP